MFSTFRNQIRDLIVKSLPHGIQNPPAVLIDIPSDKTHGEFTCNIALQLSRSLKKSPMIIASDLILKIRENLSSSLLNDVILNVEAKQPGFINFYLSPKGFYKILENTLNKKDNYGKSNYGEQIPFCLEFVSANPTGPLTVAHGRQAAVGDTLVNILNAIGYKASREYYVNDEGNQINILGKSIELRAKEAFGEKIDFPEDYYQGGYIQVMADKFLEKHSVKSLSDLEKLDTKEFRRFGVDYLMAVIKTDLEDFGVYFDTWSYQSKIANDSAINDLLKDFQNKQYVYEHEGAWWFKSTVWGDDKDRVVRKSTGEYTYLTPDIVYHKDKFARGFKRIVNILGPDHHGYIPRIKAAAAALGHCVDDLDVLIVQLATIYRGGKPVSMSTRKGEFITLREVIDEVGRDAGRFFFLMRQANAHLDFDLELAKKTSSENPVYYIQYAHARIHSIITKAHEELKTVPKRDGFQHLTHTEEIDIMRKIAIYPEVLILCAKQLEPFGLIRYLQELSGCFHKFYDSHRVLDDDKEISCERLGLIESVRIILGQGLKLLGVSAPKKM